MNDRYSSSSDLSFDSTLNDEADFDRLFQTNISELKKKRILQENTIFLEGLPDNLASAKVKFLD